MSEIRPFRALRYDPARCELSRVIVPPYDVIAPDERRAFYARDPHNAIRLELTRSVEEEAGTDYAEIPRTLRDWREQGVLVRDARPGLYGLRQRFATPDGGQAERAGFFALLRLEDYDRRVVRPHERTLAAPVADRLKQLRAAQANLSSVFLLYEDRGGALDAPLAEAFAKGELARARDQSGVEHALSRSEDPDCIGAVRAFLAERPLVIADGHHRYETALAYRTERRAAAGGADPDPDAPHEWILAYLANAYAPGSLLLPIHRLIRKGPPPTAAAWSAKLPGWTHRALPIPSAEAIPRLLAEQLAPLADRHAFAADDGSGVLHVFSRPFSAAGAGEPSVRAVHREVIEGVFGLDERAVREGAIGYPRSALHAARDLREGRGAAVLYLNPLSPDDVFRVTAAGEVLPQKSTFFHPKLPTGLVFRPLSEDD